MTDDPMVDLVTRWRQDAMMRKARVGNDPIASTLEVCAAELDEALLREAARPLTPSEYAVREGVSEQTVTSWCRRGALEAYKDRTGHWKIPPHATHQEAA